MWAEHEAYSELYGGENTVHQRSIDAIERLPMLDNRNIVAPTGE